MKKIFDTIFKILFIALTIIDVIAVTAYTIYIAAATVDATFAIFFGAFLAVNIIANVVIGKKLVKENIIKFKKPSKVSNPVDSIMPKI